MQAIARGIVSIDTFFIMSGLLVSYSLLRELKSSNGYFNVSLLALKPDFNV